MSNIKSNKNNKKKPSKKVNPGAGRPNYYDTKIEPKLDVIAALARRGMNNKEIATNIGVSVSTFESYEKKKLALREALRNGKDHAILLVENQLFKNCFEKEEVTITAKEVLDREGNVRVLTETKTFRTPPHMNSMIFFLSNRATDLWSRNIENEVRDKNSLDEYTNAILGITKQIAKQANAKDKPNEENKT